MFYSDKPISSNNDDLLKRSGFAKLLANTIQGLNTTETYTIGLYGKWGNGKTSLINMMLEEIKMESNTKTKSFVVQFEPWNFSNTNQLLTQFFIRLSNALKSDEDKTFEKIGEALEKYSGAFELAEAIPVVGKIIGFFGKQGLTALGQELQNNLEEQDILKQKEIVVDLLKKQSNRILIIIDDIDRLNNEQIRHIFKLITSVANFPNTTYLLSFDKEVVVRALERIQEGSGEEYLEKIIQIPIQVPDINRAELRKILFTRLDKILEYNKEIIFNADHWQKVFRPCIDPFINNLRDVNRLCNSIQFKLTTISSEVEFSDFIAISALEINLPQIYNWIKGKRDLLTGDDPLLRLEKRKPEEWHKIYQEEITFLLNDKNVKTANAFDNDFVMNILTYLFPYFGDKVGKSRSVFDKNQTRKNNQIAHPEKFDRYFQLNLSYINIKRSEVLQVVNDMSVEEIISFILESDKNQLSFELIEEIKVYLPNVTPDRVKIIIKALLDTANTLEAINFKNIFHLDSKETVKSIVFDLLDKVTLGERFSFFSELISNANTKSIASIASIINMIELGYGRLAAEGTERDYKKLLNLNELIAIEILFSKKVRELLKENTLFDFYDWAMVCYLLEKFESDFAKEYLSKVLTDDINILKYLDGSISTWIGSEKSYSVKDDYKKYLDDNIILAAIQRQINSGELFRLSKVIQSKCGAFFLNVTEKQKHSNHISQASIDDLLNSWQIKN